MFTFLMVPAVLTRLETYKFLHDEQTASVVASLLHEMALIATARGITLEDIALFPIKTLSQRSHEDTVAHIREIGNQFASQAPTHKVSTLQDMEQGKPRLEVEETLGYAVRQGVELGVPTPTLDTCYKLIAGINHDLS
jgi:ketopantoate reductase